MRKLITIGMLVATVTFAGAAFAETSDEARVQALERETLSRSSAQTQSSAELTRTAGPGAAVKASRAPETREKVDFGSWR